MKRILPIVFAHVLGFGLLAGFTASAQFEQELQDLRNELVKLQEAAPESHQADALRVLAYKASDLAARYPDRLEPRIWEALILDRYAEATGGTPNHESVPEIMRRLRAEAGDQRARQT